MRNLAPKALAAAALLAVAGFGATAASATASYNITSTGLDPSVGGLTGTVNYTYKNSVGKTVTLNESASIGRLQLSGTEVVNKKTVSVSFDSYCVDLLDALKKGTFTDGTTATTLKAFTSLQISQVTTLLQNVDPLVDKYAGTGYSAIVSAAAQLSVWEILYETSGTWDVTKGVFSVSFGNSTSGYYADLLANSWLKDVSTGAWKTDGSVHLSILQAGAGNQSQVYLTAAGGTSGGNGGTPAVPEPASWAMMIAGFGMVGATMRSRRRTTVRAAA